MPIRDLWAVQRRIIAFIRPYWKVVVGAFFMTAFVSLARLSQAKFVGLVFELMTEDQFTYADGRTPFTQLNLIIGAFLILMVAMGVGSFLQKYLVDLGCQSAIRDLRIRVFRHLQQLSLSFFDRMRLGEIHSRCSNDILVATSIYTTLSDFLKNFLIVAVAMGWMLYQDYQLTLLVLLLSPIIGLAVGRFGKRMGEVSTSLQSRVADLSAIMYENISCIKVVKAFNREPYEIDRFAEKNEENFHTQMKLVKVASTQSPVIEFLGALGIVAIVWFGATRILQGQATFAEMTEYWTLLVMTTQPINALSSFYSNLQASGAAGERVFSVLDTEPTVFDRPDAQPLPPVNGEISFEDVHFSYEPDKPVLQGIDLRVKPGEVVAIVGPNGAGKSTFVNLLPRFYDPDRGRITVDGHDLRDVTLHSLREQVGTVIQESVLFGGTIAENIACGRTDFSQEQIEEAARAANAEEFIRRLPDGYETAVGERGERLSGGQRQRIAIARALLRNPRVLVLDEFTSGIDTESENLITEAIERIMRGRTSLVIAHRLNTIRHADRIVVIDSGRIVEEGTHQKLLNLNGLYAKLYHAQLRSPLGAAETERKGA